MKIKINGILSIKKIMVLLIILYVLISVLSLKVKAEDNMNAGLNNDSISQITELPFPSKAQALSFDLMKSNKMLINNVMPASGMARDGLIKNMGISVTAAVLVLFIKIKKL